MHLFSLKSKILLCEYNTVQGIEKRNLKPFWIINRTEPYRETILKGKTTRITTRSINDLENN